MEVDLLARGVDLLDWWRGSLSTRRLLVLLRHPPQHSEVEAVVTGRPWWTVTDQLLDEIRMTIRGVNGEDAPAPHHLSPVAVASARRAAERSADSERRARESAAREAARQERLAARRERGDP